MALGDGVEGIRRKPVVDGRPERARAHAVDADAVAGVFDGGDLGQLNHRRLGGAIGRGVRPGGQTGDRGGQDDGARVLRAHDADGGTNAVRRHRGRLTRKERSQSSVRRLWIRPLGERIARVADQDVEAAEALDRPRDHGLDLVVVADVRQHRLDRAARRGHAGDGRVQRRRAHVAEHQVGGRLAGDLLGHGGTERPARADDRHDPLRRRHTNKYPPSTLSTVPVMKAEASEARNW